MATVKPCPRCKRLIPWGMSYCPECKPIAEAERQAKQERREAYRRQQYNKRYNARRDPKYGTFYRSKAWRQASKAKLASIGYQCEAGLAGCGGIACEVHHKQPIKTPEGWDRRLDWSNLMGVCIQCHNILDGKNFRRSTDAEVVDLRTVER